MSAMWDALTCLRCPFLPPDSGRKKEREHFLLLFSKPGKRFNIRPLQKSALTATNFVARNLDDDFCCASAPLLTSLAQRPGSEQSSQNSKRSETPCGS